MAKALAADAVIFGAVGGPKWDERALSTSGRKRGCCACARTSACSPICGRRSGIRALADASSLKRDLVDGLDILIVRELTGGVYFGEPNAINDLGNGQKRGVDTQVYDTFEIERIARVAFDLARTRRNKVLLGRQAQRHEDRRAVARGGDAGARPSTPTSSSSTCWPTTARMQLVRAPSSTTSSSPTICSATCCPTSRRCSPARSACCRRRRSARRDADRRRQALYEPVHGSAPDIAGKGIANPIAMMRCRFAMALRYSFDLGGRRRPHREGGEGACSTRASAPPTSRRRARRGSRPARWATRCCASSTSSRRRDRTGADLRSAPTRGASSGRGGSEIPPLASYQSNVTSLSAPARS